MLYADADPLKPEDIPETIGWIVQLPPHVNIKAIELMPTSQAWSPFAISRRAKSDSVQAKGASTVLVCHAA